MTRRLSWGTPNSSPTRSDVTTPVTTPVTTHAPPEVFKPIRPAAAGAIAATAAGTYWLAFGLPGAGPAVLLSLLCLCVLARLPTARRAFYVGLLTGVAMFAPHLAFFWTIFGPFASLLCLVAGLPIGVFLMLLNLAHRRLGPAWACGLAPVLWTGIEYFRSEMYY